MGLLFTNAIQILLLLVWLLVVARVLLSWVDPGGRTQAGSLVIGVTEPFLGPIRRALPPTGAMDLSPLVVLIIVGILLRVF